jgi:hypothetical protein
MSMPIVHHVLAKSQTRGSARTLLLTLSIHANECCGVAWPSDATLFHETNVSRQRVHELKNALEETGELLIVERPGRTNLYFVAVHGQPLGPQGEYQTTKYGQHLPSCPRQQRGVSDAPDRGVSDPPDRGCQESLTQQQTKTSQRENNVDNVGSDRTKPQKPVEFSEREEALAQEIARHLDGDDHSLGAIRRVVSDRDGLGEDIARRLFDDTMERLEAHQIHTSPGRYFIDLAKREAQRQGVDLGFKSTHGRGQWGNSAVYPQGPWGTNGKRQADL